MAQEVYPTTLMAWIVKVEAVKLSIMLDPIPLVPVGFGAFMSTTDYKSGGLDNFSGNEMGVYLSAWSPIEILGLTPYAKFSYLYSDLIAPISEKLALIWILRVAV